MSDLDSIVKLYTTQQHANELYDRHVADISTLCRGNAGGFSLQDIIKVTQILDAMLVLILEGSATFIEPACWLIRFVPCQMKQQHLLIATNDSEATKNMQCGC